jgi:hypothetical protein
MTDHLSNKMIDPHKAEHTKTYAQGRGERGDELFLLRLWLAQEEEGRTPSEKRHTPHGRVLNVLSGEAHSFDSWQHLVEVLSELASGDTPDGGHSI